MTSSFWGDLSILPLPAVTNLDSHYIKFWKDFKISETFYSGHDEKDERTEQKGVKIEKIKSQTVMFVKRLILEEHKNACLKKLRNLKKFSDKFPLSTVFNNLTIFLDSPIYWNLTSDVFQHKFGTTNGTWCGKWSPNLINLIFRFGLWYFFK